MECDLCLRGFICKSSECTNTRVVLNQLVKHLHSGGVLFNQRRCIGHGSLESLKRISKRPLSNA